MHVFWPTARLTRFFSYLHAQQTASSFLRGLNGSRKLQKGIDASTFFAKPNPVEPFVTRPAGVAGEPLKIINAFTITNPDRLGKDPLPQGFITIPKQQSNAPKVIKAP
jgi:hypothetical protein